MFTAIAVAGQNDSEKRIDRIIRKIFPSLKLGMVYREIRKGRIRVNNKNIEPDYRIAEGDSIEIHDTLAESVKRDIENLLPAKTRKNDKKTFPALCTQSTETVFENTLFAAVNKPAGLAVHPGSFRGRTGKPGYRSNEPALSDMIKAEYGSLSECSISFTPAPLHRLDRNTSGIIFFSKSIEGARLFSLLMREGKIKKKYIALLDGKLEKKAVWKDFISQNREKGISGEADESSGRRAVTEIRPLISTETHTLADIAIETGRYHQIRKQCAMHGFPLTGDRKYGSSTILQKPEKKGLGKENSSTERETIPYLLHCYSVSIGDENPGNMLKEKAGFEKITAPLPDYYLRKISEIFAKNDIEKQCHMLYS